LDTLIAIASRIAATKNVRAIVHNGNSGIDGEAEGLGLNVVVGVELADGVGDGDVWGEGVTVCIGRIVGWGVVVGEPVGAGVGVGVGEGIDE